MASKKRNTASAPVPPVYDWRTTDADEIERRRQRARDESFIITNQEGRHPIFSNFAVKSDSGMKYSVEIREIGSRQFACNCVDFRINGLGTCKHVEAVLLYLESRYRRLFKKASAGGSTRIDVVPITAEDTLCVTKLKELPKSIRNHFGKDGRLRDSSLQSVLSVLSQLHETDNPHVRISQEIDSWLENRQRVAGRTELRREYELKVQNGEWPAQETKVPLFPYQREGMLHLAFTERALLADEMGLGKTIQAIAACALLHRLGQAEHVLIVTPASLKTEWEDQIQKFTELPYQLIFGQRHQRLDAYSRAPFFTIANYEQIVRDALDVNLRLNPEVVVLDEAQRIKNWNTKTAQAVKRLRSRYAFVLTGTPIENRIDELHSLMDFLNPSVLGPLFRFNRDFYELDDRGRPKGYRNLDQLHARIKPYMLRRRKADVETELPERTDRTHFVPMSNEQRNAYQDHETEVARLMNAAKRRPLTQKEQDKLQRELAMMRMLCDTTYILDPEDRTCPKLGELQKILEECRENDTKVIVFSEWERMLQLVRELCDRLKIGFAWHTGSVPQRRRRAEINLFKTDPNCRVFLTTDSGSTGLNLQSASVVINCDLPWNPAKLEQRIARAWRKHQTRPVTVINLVSENTIEHRMIETLGSKQALAQGVLDLQGDLKEIRIGGGRQAFLSKLQQLIGSDNKSPKDKNRSNPLPADRSLAFSRLVREKVNGALVRCEERYPQEGCHSVLFVVVDRDSQTWSEKLRPLHEELFGPDKSDPLTPTQIEVVDRATDEAIQRLIAAGLITKTTRASRPLFPEASDGEASKPLSHEEQQQAGAHRAQAQRKLKMARLLGDGGLTEESRTAILEAIPFIARALALENRLPEPAGLDDALLPPLTLAWKENLPALRNFIEGANADWRPVAGTLEKL